MDFYWSDFVAGSIGGIGGTFVGHPIDTIKVRQQTHVDGFLSARKCFQQSLKTEGPTGLFKGMSSPLYTAALVNATFFGVYGNALKLIQKTLGNSSDTLPCYQNIAAAGMVAGSVQLIVSCPVELVKIKLQTKGVESDIFARSNKTVATVVQKPLKGPIDWLIALYKTQGIKGWYKGFVPMFWRDGPSSACYMALYEWLNREGKKFTGSLLGDTLVTVIAGGVTGAVTWISVLPIDVIKSRIQADCPVNPKYRGMIHCMRVSYREQGWKVFSRGFYAITIRALVVNAATFLAYETTLWHLSQNKKSNS